MLKGLIFDLDGVLTDTAKFHLTAWNDLAKKLGIDLTEKQLNSLRGISRIRHGKPDPEIYEKAQQLLQLNRDEVISFEDAAAGVEAIKAAGQFAVGIGDKQMLKDADYVVESTKELKLAKIEAVFLKNNEKVG